MITVSYCRPSFSKSFVFMVFSVPNVKLAFSNSSGSENVFEKFAFRDGVWKVGQNQEAKKSFQSFPALWNVANDKPYSMAV